jgi:hypothetical protein
MSAEQPNTTSPQIDLGAIKKQIDSLNDDQLKDALLKLRIREKKQQKKSYGSPNQKTYAARQREKRKLMIALAREKGLMDAIDTAADEAAEAELAEEREAAKAAESEE